MHPGLISVLSSLFFMLAIDAMWLGWMMKGFYRSNIGHLMNDSPKIIPATFFI